MPQRRSPLKILGVAWLCFGINVAAYTNSEIAAPEADQEVAPRSLRGTPKVFHPEHGRGSPDLRIKQGALPAPVETSVAAPAISTPSTWERYQKTFAKVLSKLGWQKR